MEIEKTVNDFKNGDSQAFETLYKEYYREVCMTINGIIKDESDAEDLANEVFIKIYHKIDELKNPSSFGKWLRRITVNTAVAYIRKNKRTVLCDDETQNIESIYSTEIGDYKELLPEKNNDREETKRMMLEIINNIPDKMRVVIYMHFYSKMSVSDIAEELGISEGTVKSRIYYGKKHIKEQVLAYEKDGIKLYNADILDILEKLISDIAKISEFPTSFNVSAVTDAITSSTLFKLGFSAAANTSVNAVNSSFSAKISIAAAAIAIAVGGFAMIYIPKIPANASNEISSDSESSYTDSDNKG